MADTLTLWKPVTINLKASRDRINTPTLFNKKQRKVLLKMIDFFEEGNLKEMIEIGQCPETKLLFEYPTWEYLEEQYYDIARDAGQGTTYKREEI